MEKLTNQAKCGVEVNNSELTRLSVACKGPNITYQAKCGVEVDGAGSDDNEKAPNEIDSSGDVLGIHSGSE